MRQDKLTTAFMQALADAQSLAVTNDNPYIEPSHLLAAMLQQADGPRALLDRAGANTNALTTAIVFAVVFGGLIYGGIVKLDIKTITEPPAATAPATPTP